jgi:hypothetical protein
MRLFLARFTPPGKVIPKDSSTTQITADTCPCRKINRAGS